MEERNCYLVINKIVVDTDEGVFLNSWSAVEKIVDFLRDRHDISITGEGLDFLRFVAQEILEGKATGVILDMLELTYDEAQCDVNYLSEQGLYASIEYRETNTINNNFEANVSAQSSLKNKADKNNIDLDFMKQYLKDLYILEKNKYCSEQVKQKYDNIINSLGKTSIDTTNQFYGTSKGKIDYTEIIKRGVLYGIGGALAGVFIIGWLIENIMGSAIVGFIIGFLFGALMGWWDEDNYKTQKDKEYQNKQADNERIKKELEQSKAYIEKRAAFIKNVHSCNEALNQLYSLNIIFPKYRNFIAISQIYEYFMSGRCTELEGHEGAYNIFENEVRQNIIIMQLNEALNQLEQIKQNQYMIYQALQEANLHLAKIESNTEAIKYNTAVIAENSAICARYAETRVY